MRSAENSVFGGRKTARFFIIYLFSVKIEAPKLLNIGQFSVFFWKTGRSGSNPFVITKIPPSIRTTALWRRRRDLKCGAPPLAVPEKILGLYAARFFRPLRRRLLADSATGGARNQRPRRAAIGFKSFCYNKNTAVHSNDGIVAEKEGFEVRCTPACGARKNSRALRRSIFSTAAPPACSLIPPPAALAINARAERRSGSNPFVITKIPPSIRTTALWRRRRDLKCGAPPLAVPEKILGLYAARFFRPLRRSQSTPAPSGARAQIPLL